MRNALGDVDAQIKEAKRLMDLLLTLNPSSDDKNKVDLKLEKCQALYDAEGVVNLPIISHVASTVCYDELVTQLNDLVKKYQTRPAGTAPVAVPSEGFPTWGYFAIAGGSLAGLGALAWALAPSKKGRR